MTNEKKKRNEELNRLNRDRNRERLQDGRSGRDTNLLQQHEENVIAERRQAWIGIPCGVFMKLTIMHGSTLRQCLLCAITGRLFADRQNPGGIHYHSLPTASPETKTKNYRKSRLIKVLSHQGQFSDLKVANNPINLRKLHFPTHSSQLLSPKIYTCSRDSDADLSDRTEACRLDAE